MKTLIIVRHAKSSWKHNVMDHDRPLKKRGFNDAEMMAKYTSNLYELPDKVITSTANRAKTTAGFFKKHWSIPDNIFYENSALYDFSGEELLKIIKSCEDTVDSLMVFGHNFAITDFVNIFGSTHIDNVPTCGFVELRFDINSWQNLKKGETVYTLFPKQLKQ